MSSAFLNSDRWRSRLNLRQRYAITIAAVSIVIVALVQVTNFTNTRRMALEVETSTSEVMSDALIREVETASRNLAGAVAASLIEPVALDDFEGILHITSSVLALPSVSEIRVYDATGTVIHDGTEAIGHYGEKAPPAMLDRVLLQKQEVIEVVGDTIEICVPIMVTGRVLGALKFSASLQRVFSAIDELKGQLHQLNQTNFRKQIFSFIGMAILFSIMGIIVGATIADRFTRPIRDVIGLTRQIGRREYGIHLPWRRSDELGELASALKGMASELEESTVSRSQLAREVRDRTRELTEANEQLKSIDKGRRRFFAEVSHEIRTPLAAIQGEAEVTLRCRSARETDYRGCLEKIVTQAKHIGRLVNDLLTLARSDQLSTDYSFAPVRLSDVVGNACEAAGSIAKIKQIDIVQEEDENDMIVLGDQQKLFQLFLILIENAVRYSPEQTRIGVHATRRNGTAHLAVMDHGIGMEREEIEHAFDPFHRGDQARKMAPMGAGLGLPIAKSIVAAHQGQIGISSEAEGTTIAVQLPLHHAGDQLH